jgi:hypothetical protein
MHLWIRTLLTGTLLLAASALSQAQTTRPARIADSSDNDGIRKLLGERFISQAAGISFRAPIGGKQARRTGVGSDLIVTYSNPDEQWTLKCSRIIYPRATHLVPPPPAPLPPNALPPAPEVGVLDAYSTSLKANIPNLQEIRKDIINLGNADVGLLISRYTRGPQAWLHQAALIQSSDQVYYVLDFETPSGHTAADKPDAGDPAEQTAYKLFQAILDSTVLIDQRPIIQDTQDRIFRALSFQVNIPSRIKQIMRPEQYFRVIRNGKDAGWFAQYEEWGVRQDHERNPVEGLIVATITDQTFADESKLTVASEMFSLPDRKKGDEMWVTISIRERPGIDLATKKDSIVKDHVTEWGQSRKDIRTVLLEGEHENDRKKLVPNATVTEQYKLRVTTAGSQDGGRTITRDLPAYYLPQAQAAMLPRLVSYKEPKGYVFLVWVASEQQLIHRFVDVGSEEDVKFNGKMVRAIIIKDRISLEGDPTFHYFTVDGKYLGNFTPATATTTVGTDLATLKKLYPQAKIQRPFSLDTPQPEGN